MLSRSISPLTPMRSSVAAVPLVKRSAPEAFVTLRPTLSSKWTWRFSYSMKKSTSTESKKRDGHGKRKRYQKFGTYLVHISYLGRTKNKITVHGWRGLTKGLNSTSSERGRWKNGTHIRRLTQHHNERMRGMNGTHTGYHKAGQYLRRNAAETRRKIWGRQSKKGSKQQ